LIHPPASVPTILPTTPTSAITRPARRRPEAGVVPRDVVPLGTASPARRGAEPRPCVRIWGRSTDPSHPELSRLREIEGGWRSSEVRLHWAARVGTPPPVQIGDESIDPAAGNNTGSMRRRNRAGR
jgi:hypothetical protein